MTLKMPVVVTLFGHFNLQPREDGDVEMEFDHMSTNYVGTIYGLPEGVDFSEETRQGLLRMAALKMGEAHTERLKEKGGETESPKPNPFGNGGATA